MPPPPTAHRGHESRTSPSLWSVAVLCLGLLQAVFAVGCTDAAVPSSPHGPTDAMDGSPAPAPASSTALHGTGSDSALPSQDEPATGTPPIRRRGPRPARPGQEPELITPPADPGDVAGAADDLPHPTDFLEDIDPPPPSSADSGGTAPGDTTTGLPPLSPPSEPTEDPPGHSGGTSAANTSTTPPDSSTGAPTTPTDTGERTDEPPPPSSEPNHSESDQPSDSPPPSSALPLPSDSEPTEQPASSLPDGHPVRFSPWAGTGLEEILYSPDQGAPGAYGAGAALSDFTGDGRLDLFLGAGSRDLHEACLYRNVSTAEQVHFEPLPEACTGLGPMLAGIALPRSGRPGDDLLLFGENSATLLSMAPDGSVRTDRVYRITTSPGNPTETCVALSALVIDLTFDGVAEIIIGCGAGRGTFDWNDDLHARNRILRTHSDRPPELLPAGQMPGLEDNGATLALGWIDLARNGLPDVMIVNDTFSTTNMRNLRYRTGTVQRRCDPSESCAMQPQFFASDPSAWGSFMGVGEALVGEHRRWYVTDWGPNRLLHWDGQRLRDEATLLGVQLDRVGPYPLFAWSAIVDDFNGNGLDDILVTQGSPQRSGMDEELLHRDVLLLQEEPAFFVHRDEEVGLPPPSFETSRHEEFPTSSRGGLKADLNLDGRLDLILLDFRAPPRIMREVVPEDRPLRCNVDPVSRLVPTVGTGFAFARDHGRTFRTWDVQGHMLFGAPPRLLLPWQRGILRFPSGAEIPFNCEGTPGPIELVEPDWLVVEAEAETVRVAAEAPWLFARSDSVAVTVAFLRDDPEDVLALDALHVEQTDLSREALEDGWRISSVAGADTVMVRFGERWVPRRFPIH